MNEAQKSYWDNFDQKLYKEYLDRKDAWRKRQALKKELLGKINLN